MIVPFHCSIAYSQSSVDSLLIPTGVQHIKRDTVRIALSAIRLANIKLINGDAAIQIVAKNDSIISMKDTQIDLLKEAIAREQKLLIALNKSIELYNDENNRLRKQRNFLAGSTVGLAVTLILLLF